MFSFHEERGRFGAARVRVVEEGPVRIVVRARSSFGSSTLLQDFILYRDIPRITVRAVVDWHEKLSLLKISFPVNVQKPAATYEIPYGHIQRPCNGEEEPGQNWVDVSGEASAGGKPTSYGLSVLNDCTYSFDVRGGDLRLTILRSPVYAHHTPTVLEENGDYVYMDQGRHVFSYELVPHAGSWQDGETVGSAQVLNAPLFALVEHVHAGDLPGGREPPPGGRAECHRDRAEAERGFAGPRAPLLRECGAGHGGHDRSAPAETQGPGLPEAV